MKKHVMKTYNSIALFFERRRPADTYHLFYINGYIYGWAERLLTRVKSKGDE